MVGCGLPTRLIMGQRERGSRGQCRGRTGCGPSRRRTADPASRTGGDNDRGVGVLTGWQHLVHHSGGGQLDDGLRGAEELPWGGGRLIIVTAVYGSQSGPRGGSSSGVDLAAIATEHACRLIATFDPSEVRTVIHVAVYEHLPR
jgi:hypothetical protein